MRGPRRQARVAKAPDGAGPLIRRLRRHLLPQGEKGAHASRLLPTVLAALLALVVLLAGLARADEADKGVLANLISQGPLLALDDRVIGAVQGVLSSDATISDIVLSDREGPWLKVDKAKIVWSRLALLSRRLEVDQLTIGHMQVLRRPLPSETPPPAEAGPPQPILPELPVKVIVKQFAIDELALGEPVAGVAARLALNGKAMLGPPSEGLDLSVNARRLDAGGELKAILAYVPQTDRLTVSVNSAEPAGGIFAHLANLPGLPPAKFSLEGAGPLDNFDAKLDFAAGADVWARGDVTVARQDGARRLTLDLRAQLAGMTPPIVRPVFAGETTLKGAVLFNDNSSIATPGLHLVSANARLDVEGGKTADDRLDVRIHAGAIPGSTEIGKLDLNATIAGPASSPTIDGAVRRRRHPRFGGLARSGGRDLQRAPERRADRRGDANRVRRPGEREGARARRQGARGRRRAATSRSPPADRRPRAERSPSTRSISSRRSSRRSTRASSRPEKCTGG